MSMMETEQQGIVILDEDAEEGKPCEALKGCGHEAAYIVTFVFPEGHSCANGSPARLCVPHTDRAKVLFATGELVCLTCYRYCTDLIIESARGSLCRGGGGCSSAWAR